MKKKIILSPTGQLQYIPDPSEIMAISFKSGVPTYNDLPLEGNELNDARITNDNHHLYIWNGSEWVDQGDILDIYWESISNKPDQFPTDWSLINNKPFATQDVNYYVDSVTGDDNNPGTQTQPFKTINKAISLIPKYLDRYAYRIYLFDGTYNENVELRGYACGLIQITSVSGNRQNVLLNGYISIYRSDTMLFISNISIKNSGSACIYFYMAKGQVSNVGVSSTYSGNSFGVNAQNSSIVQVGSLYDYDSNVVTYGVLAQSGSNVVFGSVNAGKVKTSASGGICSPVLSSKVGQITYYVDPINGNDSNIGTEDKPYKTIAKAISMLDPYFLKYQDEVQIILKPGEYEEIFWLVKLHFKGLTIKGSTGNPDDVILKQPNNQDFICGNLSSVGRIDFQDLSFLATNSNTLQSGLINSHGGMMTFNNCKFGALEGVEAVGVKSNQNSSIVIGNCSDMTGEGIVPVKYAVSVSDGLLYYNSYDFGQNVIDPNSQGLIIKNGKIEIPYIADVKYLNNNIDYWIDINGDDSNDGSQEHPLRTIQEAINRIVGNSNPNTTIKIYINPGEYEGFFISGFAFGYFDLYSSTNNPTDVVIHRKEGNDSVIYVNNLQGWLTIGKVTIKVDDNCFGIMSHGSMFRTDDCRFISDNSGYNTTALRANFSFINFSANGNQSVKYAVECNRSYIVLDGDLYNGFQNIISDVPNQDGVVVYSNQILMPNTNWDKIVNKPDSYPTTWDLVSNKPDQFPTDWNLVNNKPDVFPSDWDIIQNKPTTFPANPGDRPFAMLFIYVDAVNGDDENDGSEGHPLKTIQRAVQLVENNKLGVNIINIAPGEYTGRVDLQNFRNIWLRGNPDSTIIYANDWFGIRAYESNVILDGMTIIVSDGCSGIDSFRSRVMFGYQDAVNIKATNSLNTARGISSGWSIIQGTGVYFPEPIVAYPYWDYENNLWNLNERTPTMYSSFSVTHRWVDPINGDDSNPGTELQPFRTISRALDSFGGILLDVHRVIHLKSGTYEISNLGIGSWIPDNKVAYIIKSEGDVLLISNDPDSKVLWVTNCKVIFDGVIKIKANANNVTCIGATMSEIYIFEGNLVLEGSDNSEDMTRGIWIRGGKVVAGWGGWISNGNIPVKVGYSMEFAQIYAPDIGETVVEGSGLYAGWGQYLTPNSLASGAVQSDGDGSLKVGLVESDTEPDVPDRKFKFWYDTTNDKLYLIYNLNGTRKKVELT
jgi:pectin methylesterase-like acyl-CoA thioesterase